MPTTRVPAYRCGADLSGWFMTDHPIMEDGEIHGTVCFSNRPSFTPLCKYSTKISVKTVDPTSSKNLVPHLLVTHATVVQNE